MSAGGENKIPRIYLAGPEVFLRRPAELAAAKKKICADLGLEGVFPLDSDLDLRGLSPRQAGQRISAANEQLMRDCDALIANLTPFRGPGMDAGTAYEIGFMRALGRPTFAYSNRRAGYLDRVIDYFAGALNKRADGSFEDPDALQVEHFEMHENLMIEGAVLASGASVVAGDAASGELYTDLAMFRAAAQQAARLLLS